MTCVACADKARFEQPTSSHTAFMRALLFGIGAAVAGLILYAVVGIVTGLEIGYVSLAVGLIIGKAMKVGSRGLGGKRYQVTAVLLTYLAVSMAAIPIGIGLYLKQNHARPAQQQTSQAQQQAESPSATVNGDEQATTQEQDKAESQRSVWGWLAYLAFLGVASPFLEFSNPMNGLLGLIILLVGMRIAWRMTAGNPNSQVEGPYENRAPASA